jgi:uncharacterized protein YjbJ (UPF0337 family)
MALTRKSERTQGHSHMEGKVHRPASDNLGWIATIGQKRRSDMKPSTKDQVKGNFHELKGKAKEKAGQVMNNPDLAAEGQEEKVAGKVQKKIGQVEKVFEK